MPRYEFTACTPVDTQGSGTHLIFTYKSLSGDPGHERNIQIIDPDRSTTDEVHTQQLFTEVINFMKNYWEKSIQIPESNYEIHLSESPLLEGKQGPTPWQGFVLELE